MSTAQFLMKLTSTSTNMELTKNGDDESGLKNGQDHAVRKSQSNNKAITGRRRFGENGFEEGGGYMAVKKAKLDNQFNVSARGLYNHNDSEDISEIFKGVSIHINGYTDPPEPELRELFILHGGTFHPYNGSKTTFVVATNMAASTKQRHGAKAITPAWIMDSIAAGTALDTRNYMLYNFNQEKNQMTLTQIMSSKKTAAAGKNQEISSVVVQDKVNHCNGNGSSVTDTLTNNNDDSKERVSESEEEFFECSQDSFSNPSRKSFSNSPKTHTNSTSNSNDKKSEESSDDIAVVTCNNLNIPSSDDSVKKCTTPPKKSEQTCTVNQISPSKSNHIKTATDDGFLEDFFGRSRLHLISEQKKEMQMLIGNLRKNIQSHQFPNFQKFKTEFESRLSVDEPSFSDDGVVLMHVDMDCFFVSVGLLSRPHLRGKPVVVTHSSGKVQESKSDIACASYEARKFNVRNGMWVGEAKAMCPNLEVIPYDFEEYRRVSKLFFETVASVTLEIEANSVDEMLIDVTSVLRNVPGASPGDLAAFLRKIISAETNCPASIGIGSNRLLAKLAVKLAKPDGIHHLKDADAPAYIQSLKVRDLPGVGWSGEEKLRELRIEHCGDLLKVPLNDLKRVFGEKTAEKMLNLCVGKDSSEVKVSLERPKSLSVDVNFGIRFTKEEEVTQFLMKICKELSNRAERVQAQCTHFTLKLLIRKKGAGDPLKHGGHGLVDSMTRSRTLMNPTRNWHEFYKNASSLARLMRVPPNDYRGVGVTISDLIFEGDKSGKKSVQRTLTDMPISRAQKMLSIISQKKNKIISPPVTDTCAVNKSASSVLSAITSTEKVLQLTDNTDATNVPDKSATSTVQNGISCNMDRDQAPEKKESTKSTTEDASKLPVDIAVLRQLPREIAEEQCQFYGISKDVLDEPMAVETECVVDGQGKVNGNGGVVDSFYDNVETIDESFLQALPEKVRRDVLIELQEAQGRRKVADTNTVFDDQQPCSSKQALERSRNMELQRSKNMKNAVGDDSKVEDSNTPRLEEQTTPIISYSNKSASGKLDPKLFWDMSIDYVAVPPTPSNRPALNNCVEVNDVRDLIRQGLQMIANPMPEEVEHLEKYFVQLISDGWIEQTYILLKFLHRQTVQLGADSKWKPALHKIIGSTQEQCKKLYHGELELVE